MLLQKIKINKIKDVTIDDYENKVDWNFRFGQLLMRH